MASAALWALGARTETAAGTGAGAGAAWPGASADDRMLVTGEALPWLPDARVSTRRPRRKRARATAPRGAARGATALTAETVRSGLAILPYCHGRGRRLGTGVGWELGVRRAREMTRRVVRGGAG